MLHTHDLGVRVAGGVTVPSDQRGGGNGKTRVGHGDGRRSIDILLLDGVERELAVTHGRGAVHGGRGVGG